MEHYKSDNGINPIGAILTFILAILGGFVIGAIVYFISQYIYLICIFPFIIGGAFGYVLRFGIGVGKVRNGLYVAIIGLLGSVILLGASRYPIYAVDFKNEVRDDLESFVEPGIDVTDADVNEYSDFILEAETGSTGYWGFLKLEAQNGITIGRRSIDFLTIDGTMAWIYWVIDFLIIVGVGVLLAISRTEEPFSTYANEWYKIDRFIGTTALNDFPDLMKILIEGKYDEAGQKLSNDRDAPIPRVDLYTMRSSDPTDQFLLMFSELTYNDKGELNGETSDVYGIISEVDIQRMESPPLT